MSARECAQLLLLQQDRHVGKRCPPTHQGKRIRSKLHVTGHVQQLHIRQLSSSHKTKGVSMQQRLTRPQKWAIPTPGTPRTAARCPRGAAQPPLLPSHAAPELLLPPLPPLAA